MKNRFYIYCVSKTEWCVKDLQHDGRTIPDSWFRFNTKERAQQVCDLLNAERREYYTGFTINKPTTGEGKSFHADPLLKHIAMHEMKISLEFYREAWEKFMKQMIGRTKRWKKYNNENKQTKNKTKI